MKPTLQDRGQFDGLCHHYSNFQLPNNATVNILTRIMCLLVFNKSHQDRRHVYVHNKLPLAGVNTGFPL